MKTLIQKLMTRRRNGDAGFTLIEAVVVLVVFGMIMTVTFGIFSTLSSTTVQNNQIARSQAGARVALEEIERALRSAGAEVDLAGGQQNFVWAGPYQLAFNANLLPLNDPNGTGEPAALIAGSANASVPSDAGALYTPPVSYGTGAETVIFTIDSNRDGIIDDADKSDDVEEDSQNENDYVLYRGIYGAANGVNTFTHRPVAIVRGPEPSEPGDNVAPLFAYWLDDDDDSSTPAVLAGDADADGTVTAAEAIALGPLSPRDRARVERVTITVTSETAVKNTKEKAHGGYGRVELSTDVKVRQVPRSAGVIFGVVYRDINANGVKEPSEPTIPDVVIQSSVGAQTVTNAAGQYLLTVTPGTLTVKEVDPNGYTSSTSNTATVDAYAGSFTQLNFGDVPGGGTGQVRGFVFNDKDQSASLTQGDVGIANVKIYSDTGEYTYTGGDGKYVLDVPLGTRTISQVDSIGYISTTPNTAEAQLDSPGEVVEINFGDAQGQDTGTLSGYAYIDEDRDGMMDGGEDGVFGATIFAGGVGSTDTDTQGYFTMTLPVGTYKVQEQDPPGYSSTTANILHGIKIEADQTTMVYFGDIVQDDVDFEVIELSDTEKALSITAGDLGEDNRGDPEIILGTRFAGGSNNMLIWENKRKNSKTPNAAIFDSSPSLTRASPADVTALVSSDLNGDGDEDVISGLASASTPDLNVWLTDRGAPSNTPDIQYSTVNGEVVRDMQEIDFNRDGILDLVIAVDGVGGSGHAEIWWGTGNGNYMQNGSSIIDEAADAYSTPLTTVTAARAADLNGDGRNDLVLTSVDSAFQSRVHIYLNTGLQSYFDWMPIQNFDVAGEVTQLRLGDQVEDDQRDIDILLAVQTSETSGHVEVWHQNSDNYFGLVDESRRIADDRMITNGAPISMMVLHLDNDVFPDILVGTRRNTGYEGAVEYALGFGHLLSETVPTTTYSIGAVLTMTNSDFNMDGVTDLAVGTQNTSTRGKVLVFYRK